MEIMRMVESIVKTADIHSKHVRVYTTDTGRLIEVTDCKRALVAEYSGCCADGIYTLARAGKEIVLLPAPVEAKFPYFTRVIPAEKPVVTVELSCAETVAAGVYSVVAYRDRPEKQIVTINQDYLKILANTACDMRYHGPDMPVVFVAPLWTYIVMPMETGINLETEL